MVIRFYDRIYLAGKSKSTGLYTIWEGQKVVFSGSTMTELRKKLRHLKNLADKRESRSMIADMCGTSYRAAMEDMGRNP